MSHDVTRTVGPTNPSGRWTRRQFLGLLGGALAGILLPTGVPALARASGPGRVTIGGLEMLDWRDLLPVRRTRPLPGDLHLLTWDSGHRYWRYRLRNQPITTAVIHNSGTRADYSLREFVAIDVNQTERTPYPECPYHFVIEQDGTINYCVDMRRCTWHSSRESNDYAVSVCLMGTFMGDVIPTEAQLVSGRRLLTALRREMPFLRFRPHCDMPGADTWCPGDTWPQWRDRILPLPEENPRPRNPRFYSPTGPVARGW